MAGTVGDATIGINVNANTSGLEKAQSELNKLVELAKKAEKPFKLKLEASGNGESKLVDQMKKAEELATKTNEAMRKIGTSSVGTSGLKGITEALELMQKRLKEANATQKKLGENASSREQNRAWGETTKSVNQYVNALKKAQQLEREGERTYQTSQRSYLSDERVKQAQARTQLIQERNRQTQTKSAIADERLKQSQMRTERLGNSPVGGGHSSGEDWRWRSKIKGGVAETAGMLSLGMLGAGAVISAGDKVKEAFKSGYEYNSEMSGMHGTWKTLVQGARDEGILAKQAGTENGFVKSINDQSREYGRSLGITNEAYQQMYHATESASQSKHMVRSELRIADAMGMSDDDARNFITYGVGHALDRGRVYAGNLNQMALKAPAISAALSRAFLASKSGKSLGSFSEDDVNSEKEQLRDQMKKGQISAEMLKKAINYLGDTKFKDAAKNAMQTLPGMTRAISNGIPRMMGTFENALWKPLQKMFEPQMYGLAKFFTSKQSEAFGTKAGKALAGVTKDVYAGLKAISPYAKSFSSGFVSGVKSVVNAVKSAGNFINGIGKSINKTLGGKGGNALKDLSNVFGSLTGKAAGLIAFGKIARHIPIIGNSINSLFSKIPLIGKAFAVNTSAGSKMMSAADTMMSAANKMNGSFGINGTGNSDGGAYQLRTKGDNVVSETTATRMGLTRAQKLANGKFGRFIDNTFTRGASMVESGGKFKQALGARMIKFSQKNAQKMIDFSGTKFGGGIIRSAERFGKFGKFLGKGAPGLNAILGGIDAANVIATTKKGSYSRKAGLLKSVLSTGGAILGGAGATVLTQGNMLAGMAGATGGSALMSKVADFASSKLWGKQLKQESAEQKAQRIVAGQNMVKAGFAKSQKQVGYQNSIIANVNKDSVAGQVLKTQSQQDLQNGNTKAYQNDIKKMAGQNVKEAQNAFVKAQKNAGKEINARAKQIQAFSRGALSNKQAKKVAKQDYDNSTLSKLKKQLNDAKNAQDKLGSSATKNSKKVSKASKTASKASKDASKDIRKASKSASKGQSKDAKKAAQDAVKAQKKAASETVKAMKKQQSNLKKALSTQTKGQKKELSSMKKAQSQAFKGMNKDAQKQFKSMSKLISKSTKADGKAVKRLGKNMSKGMKTAMKGMTKATKSGMKSVDKSIKSAMKQATRASKNGAKSISKSLKSELKSASRGAKSSMNGISKAVKSGINKAKSAAKSGSRSIANSVKSGLRKASAGAKSAMNKVSSSVKSGMSKAASSAKSGANKIVSSVKSGMSKVGSATKSAMDKVSTAVKSGMDKANSSMKSAFSKMVSTAQSATSKVASSFNKIGSGASSASGKVRALASAINSLHSKTVNIKVNVSGKGASKLATGTAGALNAFNSIPKYANGVGGHKGGVAIVNDGKGANWREAFMLPNGKFGMFPKIKNLMIDLPRGTQVLNGNDTARKMPHYANGTPKTKTSGHKGGVKVVIENITVNGNADKAQAQKVAKLIRNEVQAIFAGQADII